MKVYHQARDQDDAAESSSANALTEELRRKHTHNVDVLVPAPTIAAPTSLRGAGRLFWNVDRVPPGEPWPSWLPHYSGTLFINEIRFHIEGWRTENDAGRHVRLVVTSQPIHEGQWPHKE